MKDVAYLWLDDFEVSHLYPARREVRNFELDLYRSFALAATDATHAATETAHHTSSFVVVSTHRR
jgi:hypothetical protein